MIYIQFDKHIQIYYCLPFLEWLEMKKNVMNKLL